MNPNDVAVYVATAAMIVGPLVAGLVVHVAARRAQSHARREPPVQRRAGWTKPVSPPDPRKRPRGLR